MAAKMSMISLALVAALFSCVSVEECLSEDNNFKALKSGELDMRTRDDFDTLVQEVNDLNLDLTKLESCDAHLIRAIKVFDAVLGVPEEKVCTMEKMKLIEHYYKEFLDTSGSKSNRMQLPKPLRHFVLAYAMQVSAYCRLAITMELSTIVEPLVPDSDIEPLLRLTDEQSYIGALLENADEPGDSLMPADLFAAEKTNGQNKFYNNLSRILKECAEIHYIKIICERKLKPIYQPLIMPMTVLEGIGINYKHNKLLKNKLDEDEAKKVVIKWSKLAFLCELVDTVEQTEGLNWSERGESSSELDSETEESSAETDTEVTDEQLEQNEYDLISPIEFEPLLPVRFEGIIYNKKNDELASSVESFDTSISDSLRRHNKMMKLNTLMAKWQMSQLGLSASEISAALGPECKSTRW